MIRQTVFPAYVYAQYRDDANITAFFGAFNQLAQGYLNWFNNTPLAVYTNATISGALLDWTATGIYGLARPVISQEQIYFYGGYNAFTYDTTPYNAEINVSSSGSYQIVNDDIYKRFLTWNLYRADGDVFSIQWLKRRVARFINGANGMDTDVINNPVSVAVSKGNFTIKLPTNPVTQTLVSLVNNGIISLPANYTYTFIMGA